MCRPYLASIDPRRYVSHRQTSMRAATPWRHDVQHPVVIIGGGPIGLAAAAHAAERGMDFVVLEAGPHAAASVGAWSHVRLFSSWSELVDSAARRLLDA